jgi:hypothetical protein
MGLLDWYKQRIKDFPERFEQSFGYELVDPFDEICGMLVEGKAFSFSRFGDGEFNAIFGAEGANCDGHRYFPDLGRRLREIVESEPDYAMGLQPIAVMMHGAERIQSISQGVRWVLSDSLHMALIEGRLGSFFRALTGREILLIGAPHHQRLVEGSSWQFLEIAYRDCWTQYESLRATLERHAAAEGIVFLFCASMMANVLVDDLYRVNPRNSYIDVGSVFDPYVGVNSRNYHSELDPSSLKVRL